MIGPKEDGGLDIPEYDSIINSLLVAWVKRMVGGIDDSWMVIPSYYLNKVGGIFIFKYIYDINLLDLEGLLGFYINILGSWAEIKDEGVHENDSLKIRDQILSNNKNMTIAGKSVYYKDWYAAGISKVKDILDNNNEFVSYSNVCRKIGCSFPSTRLLGLIAAIPSTWKS